MTQSQTVSVLIVDDHAVVREALAAYLDAADGIRVAGTAASGEEAVELVRRLRPQVALLDLIMPGMNGVATCAAVKAAHAECRVLLLTSYSEGDLVQPALAAGADGYLLKSSSAEAVAQAIQTVARGQRVLDPSAIDALTRSAPEAITAREREVLHLIAEGMSNAEIAAQLGITVRTVKAHVTSLLQKRGLQDRAQLIVDEFRRRRPGHA